MIGNDLVDLLDAEARPGATHPRFDGRVFTAQELALLGASRRATSLRWMLWAAKEAAFKVARKLEPGLPFVPRRFAVELSASGEGVVAHEGRRFHLRVQADGQRVHALASEEPLEARALASGILELPPAARDPGSALREAACQALASWLGVTPAALRIRRAGRIPRLWLRGAPAPLDLSLSHHGRLGAFAAVALEGDPGGIAA